MEFTIVIAAISLITSAVVAGIQILKHWTESRNQQIEQASGVVRAKAERDAIAVKSAEGALLVMERMLTITQQSEEEMRTRLDAMRERVSTLEAQLATANARIQELQQRIGS